MRTGGPGLAHLQALICLVIRPVRAPARGRGGHGRVATARGGSGGGDRVGACPGVKTSELAEGRGARDARPFSVQGGSREPRGPLRPRGGGCRGPEGTARSGRPKDSAPGFRSFRGLFPSPPPCLRPRDRAPATTVCVALNRRADPSARAPRTAAPYSADSVYSPSLTGKHIGRGF